MRSRRQGYRKPDLTSLFDVLFIIIFAALIRAAAVENAAKAAQMPPAPKPVAPATPPAIAALRTKALADLQGQLATRAPLVIRVSAKGTVEAIEADGKRIALDVPLLEHSPDPDVALAYLGDRSAELRVCRVATLHLGAADLGTYLVIVAPAVPLADLPHALYLGLHRDLDRCFAEQHGLATIVDPAELAEAMSEKQFAKDVAKQLDRRQLRRKLLLWGALIGAIVIAVLYLTCGRGWGIGGAGKGEGKGEGTAVPSDAGPRRCSVRVTATGLLLDGKPAQRDAVVTACKGTEGADVVVTGDARQGDWDDLRGALERANVPIFTKQR